MRASSVCRNCSLASVCSRKLHSTLSAIVLYCAACCSACVNCPCRSASSYVTTTSLHRHQFNTFFTESLKFVAYNNKLFSHWLFKKLKIIVSFITLTCWKGSHLHSKSQMFPTRTLQWLTLCTYAMLLMEN